MTAARSGSIVTAVVVSSMTSFSMHDEIGPARCCSCGRLGVGDRDQLPGCRVDLAGAAVVHRCADETAVGADSRQLERIGLDDAAQQRWPDASRPCRQPRADRDDLLVTAIGRGDRRPRLSWSHPTRRRLRRRRCRTARRWPCPSRSTRSWCCHRVPRSRSSPRSGRTHRSDRRPRRFVGRPYPTTPWCRSRRQRSSSRRRRTAAGLVRPPRRP